MDLFINEVTKQNKDKLNERKSVLRSLHDDKKEIDKKIRLYTREKENPDSTMKEMTIDKKIAKYNKMKEENDNQRNVLSNEISELKKKIPKSTKPSNVNCPRIFPDKFKDVVGVSRDRVLTSPQAVKFMWDYVKEHNLYNKDTKQVEVNDVLKDLFDIEDGEIINFYNMHKFVLKLGSSIECDY